MAQKENKEKKSKRAKPLTFSPGPSATTRRRFCKGGKIKKNT